MMAMMTSGTQKTDAGEMVDARLARLRQVLTQCALLTGLPAEAQEDLLPRLQIVHIRGGSAGTVLLAQDEPGSGLSIVISGRVKVSLLGQNGREVTLSLLKPGDVFGEVSLLDGSPTSANVVAAGEAQVAVLSREAFLEHIRLWPRTAMNLMAEMARRLRRADEAIAGLALHDVEERLSRVLARMAHEEGEASVVAEGGGLMLRRRPTQQELANMVGSSRETVSRTFTSLIRRGYMVPRGRTLILTPRMLERSATARPVERGEQRPQA